MPGTLTTLIFVTLCAKVFSTGSNDLKEAFANGTMPVSTPKQVTLEDLLRAFNYQGFGEADSVDSLAQGRPLRSPHNCYITVDFLNDINLDISELIKFKYEAGQAQVNYDDPPSSEMAIAENATECGKAMAKLNSLIHKLGKLYIIMVQEGSKLSNTDLDQLKKELEKEKTNYEIGQQLAEEVKEKFNDILQQQERILQQKLDELGPFTIEQKKNLLTQTINEIYSGNYVEAKTRFEDLNDQDQIYAITYRLYKAGKVENTIKFIQSLSWLSHRAMGYDALLKEIKDHDDLGCLHLLTIQYYLLDVMSKHNKPAVVAESSDLLERSKKFLESTVKYAIEALAYKIRSGSYRNLVNYSKAAFTQKAFDMHLENIVQVAYLQNDETALKILEFSNELAKITQSARVYVLLFKEMEKADQVGFEPTLKMAFKIKALMGMSNYKNVEKSIEENVYHLVTKFPSSVRAIIWDHVCIENINMENYLCVKDKFDPESRIAGACGDHINLWELESDDDTVTFRIKDIDTGEYLYATHDYFAYDKTNRRVMTRTEASGNQDKWELRDSNWKEGEFYIYNNAHSEYLNMIKKSLTDDPQATTLRNATKGFNSAWAIYSCDITSSGNCLTRNGLLVTVTFLMLIGQN